MSELSAGVVAQLLDRLPLSGVVLCDARVIHANRSAERFFGRGGLIGLGFADLLSDEAPHLVPARLSAAAAGHATSRLMPALVRLGDGREQAVELAISPLDGAPPCLLVLIRESGWGERRAGLLETLEGDFRPIVDSSTTLVVVQDLQARILFANRMVQEFIGTPLEALRGRSMLDFIPEREHAAVIERAATRLVGSTEAYAYRATLIAHTGDEISVDVVSMPVMSEGIPVAILVTARPVKASLALADALTLTRERDAAQEESRRKSDAVAKLSHEMRTPIHLIIGMAEMLTDAGSKLARPEREIAARLLALSQHVGELIGKVLDLASIESGRLPLVSRPFSLRHTVESSLAPLRAVATARGLELVSDVAGEVPDMLRGDAGRLQQILSNLLDNAIRNTIEGRVETAIHLASTPTPDRVHLLFAVRDTGVGIPLELRTSIFEAFVQGPAVDGRPTSGIGLGLAIARELTALLGGRIWLESELGAGSVFYFTTAFGCVDPPH